ncbi:MAG: helix-turn-helix domain-containing protein [Pirellulaceae bacterium]
MASGTKIRTLSRLLDASDAPLWVIGPTGKLIYLSSGVAKWLDIDVDVLLDRRCEAGAAISEDPMDFVAASLSPPPGFNQRGTASLRVQPPPISGRKIPPIDVRYVRIGKASESMIIAIGGNFSDITTEGLANTEIQQAVDLRKRLDGWRARHAAIATIATAGGSPAARRMRIRIEVAATTRTHLAFFGPRGSGALSIALRTHQQSSPSEPLVRVEGPLMDAELLDATLMRTINRLSESKSALATVLVSELDETPIEAQHRLSELLTTFSPRLRLIGLCGEQPRLLREPLLESADDDVTSLDEEPTIGLHPGLIDVLSALSITIEPLSSRVDDIPVLATAALDARHAAHEGTAERFSRAALDALVLYPWPGNFDELESAVRHAIAAAPHESIGVEHLPLAIRSYRSGGSAVAKKAAKVSLDDSVRRYEQKIILEVLEASDGNRAEAARRLGISRARLLRKLDEMNS